jgi:hypothetical protein
VHDNFLIEHITQDGHEKNMNSLNQLFLFLLGYMILLIYFMASNLHALYVVYVTLLTPIKFA